MKKYFNHLMIWQYGQAVSPRSWKGFLMLKFSILFFGAVLCVRSAEANPPQPCFPSFLAHQTQMTCDLPLGRKALIEIQTFVSPPNLNCQGENHLKLKQAVLTVYYANGGPIMLVQTLSQSDFSYTPNGNMHATFTSRRAGIVGADCVSPLR